MKFNYVSPEPKLQCSFLISIPAFHYSWFFMNVPNFPRFLRLGISHKVCPSQYRKFAFCLYFLSFFISFCFFLRIFRFWAEETIVLCKQETTVIHRNFLQQSCFFYVFEESADTGLTFRDFQGGLIYPLFLIRVLLFLAEAEYSYRSADFKLNICCKYS